MARVRAFVVFLLAVTAGGALAYGTYNYVQRQPTAAASFPTRPVVIAAADLGIGTELRREDLQGYRLAGQRRSSRGIQLA